MAKRILIADDSVTIQKAFAMTFAGADDVTVVGRALGRRGADARAAQPPRSVIADGVMPGRSGYDLCASIKADPALRAVPVSSWPRSQQPYDEARGQKAGADGQLTKPWETNALMDRVRDVLRRGVGASALAQPPAAPAVGHPPAAPPPRSAASLPTAAIDDDEYGEISIDTGRDTVPTVPRARTATPAARRGRASAAHRCRAVPAAHHPTPPPPASTTSPGMRPSLIPGMRPGAMPPARPGTVPVRPVAGAPLPATAPPRPTAQPIGRTLMGVPAANIPIPGVMRPSMPSMPSMPHGPTPPGPPAGRHRAQPTAAGARRWSARARSPRRRRGSGSPAAARAPRINARRLGDVSASVDQKLAAIAAKGPEYEAIAKLSREIIEQVVWEVVPELAEAIIREHVKNEV